MPRPTETWEGCRWTRTDPPVNVESSEPTDHQLLFRKKWTVVPARLVKNDIVMLMPKSYQFLSKVEHWYNIYLMSRNYCENYLEKML